MTLGLHGVWGSGAAIPVASQLESHDSSFFASTLGLGLGFPLCGRGRSAWCLGGRGENDTARGEGEGEPGRLLDGVLSAECRGVSGWVRDGGEGGRGAVSGVRSSAYTVEAGTSTAVEATVMRCGVTGWNFLVKD